MDLNNAKKYFEGQSGDLDKNITGALTFNVENFASVLQEDIARSKGIGQEIFKWDEGLYLPGFNVKPFIRLGARVDQVPTVIKHELGEVAVSQQELGTGIAFYQLPEGCGHVKVIVPGHNVGMRVVLLRCDPATQQAEVSKELAENKNHNLRPSKSESIHVSPGYKWLAICRRGAQQYRNDSNAFVLRYYSYEVPAMTYGANHITPLTSGEFRAFINDPRVRPEFRLPGQVASSISEMHRLQLRLPRVCYRYTRHLEFVNAIRQGLNPSDACQLLTTREEIEACKENIVDVDDPYIHGSDNRLNVIRLSNIRNRATLFQTKPHVTAQVLDIVSDIFKAFIDGLIPFGMWAPPLNSVSSLEEEYVFIPESELEIFFRRIREFIGEDREHIYTMSRVNDSDLTLFKHVDYRVWYFMNHVVNNVENSDIE